MDYEIYRKKYFTEPEPEQRFRFRGVNGATLYYQDYQDALEFYTQVLGPPAYVEGEHTHGWQVGEGWLTLFPSKEGNPRNIEVQFWVDSPMEVDRMYVDLIAAGAIGEPPGESLMYQPVHFCLVTDPLGVPLMVVCALGK